MVKYRKYMISGLFFGVFDFFYQQLIPIITLSNKGQFVAILGIWLIPILLAVINESNVSCSRLKGALAGMTVWSTAILSYYIMVPIKLIFIGQESRSELFISNYKDQFYWNNIKIILLNDVFSSILEWIFIALIGGLVVGFLISHLYLLKVKIHFKK